MKRRTRKFPIGSLTKSLMPFVRPIYPNWVGLDCAHLRSSQKSPKEAANGEVSLES
jgi:hypothetical protein